MGGVGEAPRKLLPPGWKTACAFSLVGIDCFCAPDDSTLSATKPIGIFFFSPSLKNNKTRSLSSGWKHHMQQQQPVPASSRCSAVWSYGLELWELWHVTLSSYLFIYLFIKFVSHSPARSIKQHGAKDGEGTAKHWFKNSYVK